MPNPNFSIFTPKRNLDPVETDKAIRSLYTMMDGVQRNEAWPVGSIFITVDDTNPSDLLGYGEWIRFGAGRVLISVDGHNFNPAERTG